MQIVADDLDNIKVLPKLRHPDEKGRIFRIIWVLGLVSDSSQCYVSLLFQNIISGYTIVDVIPPELLSYCAVGSHIRDGQKTFVHPPVGQRLKFTIDSTDNNPFIEAGKAFSDDTYDLTLNNRNYYLPDCRQQLCFVQQSGNTKIIIPCFVLAAAYYFKSSSLREAILVRKLESLFHECTLDQDTRHATIRLTDAGNVGDARCIARLQLDDFAQQRLNLCKDHLYANKYDNYDSLKSLKIDFPVKQQLTIKARGCLSENIDGSKTFVVFEIIEEDSNFPFDTIDIYHNRQEESSAGAGSYPENRTKNSRNLSMLNPSPNIVRQFLESSPCLENLNEERVKEFRIPILKNSSSEQKSSYPVYENTPSDLSSQPIAPTEAPVAVANIREKKSGEDKISFNLDEFNKLVSPLGTDSESTADEAYREITDYKCEIGTVWKRSWATSCLSLKESYDHSPTNRRKYAYVTFKYLEQNICLLELDQISLPGNGCSTLILISTHEINKETCDLCIMGYVLNESLSRRGSALSEKEIRLQIKKHPQLGDEVGYSSWRRKVMEKIEGAIKCGTNYIPV